MIIRLDVASSSIVSGLNDNYFSMRMHARPRLSVTGVPAYSLLFPSVRAWCLETCSLEPSSVSTEMSFSPPEVLTWRCVRRGVRCCPQAHAAHPRLLRHRPRLMIYSDESVEHRCSCSRSQFQDRICPTSQTFASSTPPERRPNNFSIHVKVPPQSKTIALLRAR